MQTYDVMCLDINIFPLIRQTPRSTSASTRTRLLSLSQWENYYSRLERARARACMGHRGNLPPCPVHHSVPTAPARRWPRGRAVRGRQTAKISPPFHERIASHHIVEPESFYANWSILPPRIARKGAFTERYANASPISHMTRDERRMSITAARRACT